MIIEKELMKERMLDSPHPFGTDIGNNIGLEALARRIDLLILAHIQPCLHEVKKESEDMKEMMEENLLALGTCPSLMSLDNIKEVTLNALTSKIKDSDGFCNEIFQSLSKIPAPNVLCENIENVFFGVEVILKIKEMLLKPVSSAFLDDVSNVQLSHFVQL